MNAASLMPYSPLRAWVMGNEAARDEHYKPKTEEIAAMKHILREGLEAGGFGFSGTFSMANRDYDGGYLPTHVAPREEFLEMASVLRDFNRGSIEWTMGESRRSCGAIQAKLGSPIFLPFGRARAFQFCTSRSLSTNPRPSFRTLTNLKELWPWQHAAVDPYRRYNGPRP